MTSLPIWGIQEDMAEMRAMGGERVRIDSQDFPPEQVVGTVSWLMVRTTATSL